MKFYQICVFSFQLYIILFFFQGYDLDYLWPMNCKKNPWCSWQDEQKCESHTFHQVPPASSLSSDQLTHRVWEGETLSDVTFLPTSSNPWALRFSSLFGLTKQWFNFSKSCFIILRFHIKMKYENQVDMAESNTTLSQRSGYKWRMQLSDFFLRKKNN